MLFVFKVFISSIIISFASWLSFKKPSLAGFIISIPIVSIISIALSYFEHKDIEKTIVFTKSILVGIPISLLFFLPFFFSKHFGMNFFIIYFSGIVFLILGFFVHRYLTSLF